MVRQLRHRLNTLPPADRAAWIALAVGALAAVVLIVAQDPAEDSAAVRPSADSSPATDDPPASGEPATTVDGDTPLLLGGTHVRALRATLSGRTTTVTLRIRNRTGRTQRLGAGGQSLALRVGDARVRSRPLPAIPVAEGSSETARAQFELPTEVLETADPGDIPADLLVVPWSERGQKPTLGVVRLRIEVPG